MTARTALFLVLWLAAAAGAFAQVPQTPSSTGEPRTTGDADEEGRFHLGPLRFTPTIALTNVGIDNNVFNEEQNPKEDTIAEFGPAVNLWLRMGRSRLTGKAAGQYLYFAEFRNQRAWNTADDARWELPLGRVTPFIGGRSSNTRQRPGYEIDSRAHLRTQAVNLGAEVRLGGKTTLVVAGERSRYAFDQGEVFLGTDLAQALNRTSSSEGLQFRYRLTALTTFVVDATGVQDRFLFDPVRDSNSIKILPGFELQPSALISGRVFVGYRRFSARDSALPDYSGPIASVDATYILGATRFVLKVDRDLTYSFEPTEPYYALTDLGLVVTRRVTQTWDLVGRAAIELLAYQPLQSLPSPLARTDTIHQLGGGIGYRLGRTTRIGFDAAYAHRESTVIALRAYDGLRVGASFSYGLPQ